MTDDVPEETVCADCGLKNTVDHNYCPECGSNDWTTDPMFEFDEDDLPIVFSYRVYDDHHGLFKAFCRRYFGEWPARDQIANLPDEFPRLKFLEREMYFVVDEDYELEGPFLDESMAKAYASDE